MQEQLHVKCFPPEEITAICCTVDGVYCVGGGASGSLYVWEVSTGKLLKTWNAHFKKVTCLKFSDGGRELISGSADTVVAAWLLPEALAVSPFPGSTLSGRPTGTTPWRSWTAHTLPVTDVAVGAGGVNAIVVSAGLDHAVKIHSLGSGTLLFSIVLPRPLACLALDPGEHVLYVGSTYGNIYEISLVRHAHAQNSAEWSEMPPGQHSKSVNSLALTMDGSLLISGSDDSSVKVWDLRSKQVIRTFGSTGNTETQPGVTNVIFLAKPALSLYSKGSKFSQKPKSSKDAKAPLQPLAQFSKYVGTAPGGQQGGNQETLVLLRARSADYNCETTGVWGLEELPRPRDTDGTASGPPDESSTAKMVAEENARLKQQLEQALALARKWSDLNAKLQQKLIDPDIS